MATATSQVVRPAFNQEQFYSCGMKGIAGPNSEYEALMTKMLDASPRLAVCIRPVTLYRTGASGTYGPELIKTGVTFSLSLEGIRTVLKMQGIKEDPVADTSEKLKAAIEGIRDKGVIITQPKLLGAYGDEAISVFVEKRDRVIRLYINDSENEEYVEYSSYGSNSLSLQKLIPSGYTLEIIHNTVNRNGGVSARESFAIADCMAFAKSPDLLKEMARHIATSGAVKVLKTLPRELTTLTTQQALRQALDYQKLLIEGGALETPAPRDDRKEPQSASAGDVVDKKGDIVIDMPTSP